MADSANTFLNLLPLFKDAYANKIMKTHSRPGKEFSLIKQKLKKKK